ncbi:MAG: hypothetical protein ACI8T1_002313 [Verrucomicrobiales bacterium]
MLGVTGPASIVIANRDGGTPDAGGPDSSEPNTLNATPYFIHCGTYYMLALPLGDTNTLRSWTVHDHALPLPYNFGASDFNATQFFTARGILSLIPQKR